MVSCSRLITAVPESAPTPCRHARGGVMWPHDQDRTGCYLWHVLPRPAPADSPRLFMCDSPALMWERSWAAWSAPVTARCFLSLQSQLLPSAALGALRCPNNVPSPNGWQGRHLVLA